MPTSTPPAPKSSGGCFVASAACGDPFAPEVIVLSAFRDDVLSVSGIRRAFIRLYYAVSPPIAAVIARSNALRRAAMVLIVRPAVRLVRFARIELRWSATHHSDVLIFTFGEKHAKVGILLSIRPRRR